MNKSMLKLFMLRQHQGGVPVRDENGDIIYYSDKQVAKGNRVNKQVVSYGIDHRKYNKNRKEGA
tara:strand:+ start:11000 stop:11191 length:192 start_codon:yes stop_codon:yes gene_type:complete